MIVNVNVDIGVDMFVQLGYKVKMKICCQIFQYGKCQYLVNGGIEFMQLFGIYVFVDGQFDILVE